MIDVRLSGIEAAQSAIMRFAESQSIHQAVMEAGVEFAVALKDATPPGYNRRLGSSVLFSATETGAEVGYEAGVESAGRPEFDSAIRPNTSGKSVLRRKKWVPVSELESILMGQISDSGANFISTAERFLTNALLP